MRFLFAVGLVALLSACALGGQAQPGDPSTSLAASLPQAAATPIDASPFGRSDALWILRVGDLATCAVGLAPTTGLGNLTCHVPAGSLNSLHPPVVDIDASGVHAAAWPMWTGSIAELLPGQSVTIGTATCTASAGPRLHCQNQGGWIDIGANDTRTSAPPSPLTAEHGGGTGANSPNPGQSCSFLNGSHLVTVYDTRNTTCAEATPIITRYLRSDRVVPEVPAGSSARAGVDDWTCYIGDDTDRPHYLQAATCVKDDKLFRAQ
ncbi:hypothetical protein [Gordonia oryzae]|uniref:hypothetical protein n=1 Tax=Gordonia oryzae TaxID=2487349 RepID=UPI0011CE60D2